MHDVSTFFLKHRHRPAPCITCRGMAIPSDHIRCAGANPMLTIEATALVLASRLSERLQRLGMESLRHEHQAEADADETPAE